jgi:hypothetical protein
MRTVLFTTLVLMTVAGGASAGRRVSYTRAFIEANGFTRFADLAMHTGAWAPATTDGYTVSPTPRALSLPNAGQWTIVLNGQVIDTGVLGVAALDNVPVALADVDSVVFRDEAEPGASWESGRGRIEIFASRANAGWQAGVRVGGSSWMGDVGPVRFWSGAPRGGDTVGPDASAFASRGGKNWYATLSGALAQQPFVDPSMQRTSGTLRAGVRAGGGWHELVASTMDAPDFVQYREAFGRGVRMQQQTWHAGVSGRAVRGGWRTGYVVSGSADELSESGGDPVFAQAWTERRARAGIDVAHAINATTLGGFASVERRELESDNAVTRNDDTVARAGLFGQRHADRRFVLHADVAGTFDSDNTAASAGAGTDWVVRPADTVRVRVRLSQRLFAEDDNLWLWTSRGADFLSDAGIAYSTDGVVTRTSVVAADVGWTSSGVLGGVDVDLGLRRFDDAYVPVYDFTLNATDCTLDSPATLVTGQSGNVALLRTRLWHKLGNRSWADFSWVYHESFDCDDALGNLWLTVPRHRVAYAIYAQPARGWRAHLRINHASPTLWTDYAGVDGAVCDTGDGAYAIHSQVRGWTTVDIGARVAWWRDRAALDVGARNLFDAEVRFHPAGASQVLTLYAQLSVGSWVQ